MKRPLQLAALAVVAAIGGGFALFAADTSAQPAAEPAAQPIPALGFSYAGELTQGGWIRGQAPAGALAARLGDTPLVLDAAGHFFAGFDRDAAGQAELVADMPDGSHVVAPITLAPRNWQIEHVNVARSPGGASEAFMQRRLPELARINASREVNAASDGWRQQFIWPVRGRISGRFGSQRVYRGEPGAYHSGIDIAGGDGTTFVAPADGVVVLATDTPFSLEGYLLIIDHGNGLNSAFLHNSAILVREGETVRQGQPIGRIGASGRATGPHLHWGIKWREARLDPILFTGPMP